MNLAQRIAEEFNKVRVEIGNTTGTVTTLSLVNNELQYTDEEGNVTSIDLSSYLDNTTNTIVSGVLENGTLTFTREDSTTFTVDVSELEKQTKADIDALGIDAVTVNGLTVETAVPTGAVFTDTETTTSLDIVANELRYTDEEGTVSTIDLSLYLDDTNLARIISGSYDSDNQELVFTRDDSSEFRIDASMFFDDTNLVTSVAGKTGSVSLVASDISDLTATTTELNYVDGVTSPIQTQLNAKAPINNPSFTGDVTVTDKIVHSGDTNTAIRFPATDTVTVETAGTERMRIDSSGNVGIGTTNPRSTLDLGNDSSGGRQISWHSSGIRSLGNIWTMFSSGSLTFGGGLKGSSTIANGFESSTSSLWSKTAISLTYGSIKFYSDPADTVAYGAAYTPTERMRIDSSGKLLSPNGSAFVGAVSNSGNSAIMERGSNANGEYVKYADGTMICSRIIPVAISATETNVYGSTSGVLNKAVYQDINFPANFVSTPAITANPVSNTLRVATAWRRNTTQYSIAAYTDSQDVNHHVDIIAIGRWY